jgi:hypothetical protein
MKRIERTGLHSGTPVSLHAQGVVASSTIIALNTSPIKSTRLDETY